MASRFHVPILRLGTALILSALLLTGASRSSQAQNFNHDNGHYYQWINWGGGVDWITAENHAEAHPLLGMGGYLATSTSASEEAFINSILGSRSWLGGYQDLFALTDPFRWVTGEVSSFSNWAPGEPNNSGGNEDFVETFGQWNDQPVHGNGLVTGSVIEWGPSEVVLKAIAVSPNSVKGVRTVKVKVTLKDLAPPGGALLTLGSTVGSGTSNLPPTMLVPAGSKTKTITFLSSVVGSTQTGFITAYGANAKSKPLKVSPP